MLLTEDEAKTKWCPHGTPDGACAACLKKRNRVEARMQAAQLSVSSGPGDAKRTEER